MSALIWPPRQRDDYERWYPPDWTEFALCAEVDSEIFYPEKGGSTREPKQVCRSCEVRERCLEYALENDERFGIWGGFSERERRRLKRQPGRSLRDVIARSDAARRTRTGQAHQDELAAGGRRRAQNIARTQAAQPATQHREAAA